MNTCSEQVIKEDTQVWTKIVLISMRCGKSKQMCFQYSYSFLMNIAFHEEQKCLIIQKTSSIFRE